MAQYTTTSDRYVAVMPDIRACPSNAYYYGKRAVDIVGALILVLVCLPVMLLIAVAIKLDSRGPVFFCQERIGARRRMVKDRPVWEVRSFRFHKFRSMRQNTGHSLHQSFVKGFIHGQTPPQGLPSAQYKLAGDPRVTRVGRLLRLSSLDELPQLFNVLLGDMSLVGPRPALPYEVDEYQDWHRERLATLPGLTGLWQVKGRSRVSFDEMVRMDIEYIHRQSLWFDLKLILLTLPAVLRCEGAQ